VDGKRQFYSLLQIYSLLTLNNPMKKIGGIMERSNNARNVVGFTGVTFGRSPLLNMVSRTLDNLE